MKLLVTGGAGVIGSQFVRDLLDAGQPGFDEVRVLLAAAAWLVGVRGRPERVHRGQR
jgi:nucleoside-diphosphate-sugar epimerase